MDISNLGGGWKQALTTGALVVQRMRRMNWPFRLADNVFPVLRENELAAMRGEATVHAAAMLRALAIDVDGDPEAQAFARRMVDGLVDTMLAHRYVDRAQYPVEQQTFRVPRMRLVGTLS